jgi:hypothetical protein
VARSSRRGRSPRSRGGPRRGHRRASGAFPQSPTVASSGILAGTIAADVLRLLRDRARRSCPTVLRERAAGSGRRQRGAAAAALCLPAFTVEQGECCGGVSTESSPSSNGSMGGIHGRCEPDPANPRFRRAARRVRNAHFLRSAPCREGGVVRDFLQVSESRRSDDAPVRSLLTPSR